MNNLICFNKPFRDGRLRYDKLYFQGSINSKDRVKLNAFEHPDYEDMRKKSGDKSFFTIEGKLDSACFSLWQEHSENLPNQATIIKDLE